MWWLSRHQLQSNEAHNNRLKPESTRITVHSTSQPYQSFEIWIRLESLCIPPVSHINRLKPESNSNHCVFHQSAISIVWNLNQTRITVYSTSQPYQSFETWFKLESLCIPPVSHINRLKSESDSNHCVFHQSAKNHTVVRSKACEELRTLEVIARCKHSNRQQNYCLGPVGLVSGSAINTAF